jgi:ERCC4-type nuclease
MYTLRVDTRELEMIKRLEAGRVEFVRQTLDAGDFEIATAETVALIVERKTWSDLVSSLGNGHLAEQMSRMVARCKLMGARPVLLVEHSCVYDWSKSSGNLGHKFIDCCLNKYAVEGISVVRTENLAHTECALLWFLKRCADGKVPSFIPQLSVSAAAGTQRFRKKDFSASPWEGMLVSIRGVSKATAKKISEKFTNAKEFILALEAHGDIVKSVAIKGVGQKLCADIREALTGQRTRV